MKKTGRSIIIAVATVIALAVILATSLTGCICDDVIIYDPVHVLSQDK